ncbi:hypothetical protein ECG_05384 [Echinococcus granulosus]|uniref:Expressed conserved protein n=1 Tax=Echinococcus granulosus TaxID=6210 RepID=U6J2U3_ECHGR|nr:hypothetical protein EGR_04610 [Echinococcus granulosus]EUB60591.1 hypothetical protein EGR_04610 [Echinococcus granulosus]KAH9281629.1 hypothetical protein ECG_05384 [Echinococcus granulosus]CDS18294.1 expressed conserved protein [Echinococcus granulosus]
MDEPTNCSDHFELFKSDIETRSSELMQHLESSRNTFWENLHACREYVIERINFLFSELESQALYEQKLIDDKAQELGIDIMNTFERIGACVSTIDACKQSLKNLSFDARVAKG